MRRHAERHELLQLAQRNELTLTEQEYLKLTTYRQKIAKVTELI